MTLLQWALAYLEYLAPTLGVVALAALLSIPWVCPRSHRRFAAALVDLGIALVIWGGLHLAAMVSPFGMVPASLAAAVYLVFRDALSLPGGAAGSIGKRALRLRLRSTRAGLQPNIAAIIRNLPLGLIIIVAWWRSPAARFTYPALALVELLLTWLTPSNRRLGDLLAGTVVEDEQAGEDDDPRVLW